MDPESRYDKYLELRARWPEFHYHGFTVRETAEETTVVFQFEIPGLAVFEPSITLPGQAAGRLPSGRLDTPLGRRILFSLGMIELASYWKSTCSPIVLVHAGWLDEEDITWWKNLYYHGLGEFFHRNGIKTGPAEFMDLRSVPADPDAARADALAATATRPSLPGGNLIPIGGGKDSAVTLELLADRQTDNVPFMINPQTAGWDTVRIAGYPRDRAIHVRRSLHPNLLELNRLGYYSGHTPYSAVIAFVSYLAAYRFGFSRIVLSNESSANIGNFADSDVNHQYSKSYEFEQDFDAYVRRSLSAGIVYFSLLRPFNELQIARRFAGAPAYLEAFRSCNVGSRENRWCGHCSKCLFVRLILAPFVLPETLDGILGRALLDDLSLAADFDGLTGLSAIKPFECVGVAEEVRCAVEWALEQYRSAGRPLPALLEHYAAKAPHIFALIDRQALLSCFNEAHGIPTGFLEPVRKMREYVAGNT
ncbi:MAG TPA: hypothetical protein VIL27_05815 [Clostridia bacterium]